MAVVLHEGGPDVVEVVELDGVLVEARSGRAIGAELVCMVGDPAVVEPG